MCGASLPTSLLIADGPVPSPEKFKMFRVSLQEITLSDTPLSSIRTESCGTAILGLHSTRQTHCVTKQSDMALGRLF